MIFSLFCRGDGRVLRELEFGFWFMRVELNLSLGWKYSLGFISTVLQPSELLALWRKR